MFFFFFFHILFNPQVRLLRQHYTTEDARSVNAAPLSVSSFIHTHQIPNHGEHVLFLKPKWLGDLLEDLSCLIGASWAAVAA
jgi:hypothetical protein